MKVQDLRKALAQYDGDLEVKFFNHDEHVKSPIMRVENRTEHGDEDGRAGSYVVVYLTS